MNRSALHDTYAEGSYEQTRGDQYLAALPARRRDARVRLDYLGQWVRSGRLLDVGTASGAFVAEAREAGFDASGLEPTPSFVKLARAQLGVAVTEGTLEEARLERHVYAAITLWHVLEHVAEPVAQLRRLSEALQPGGVLAVEVPNAASAVAMRMGVTWPSLEPDVHVCQFTPRSLALALERAGLAVDGLRTVAITPYLPVPARLGPRHLAARAKAALWLRDPHAQHAWGHELLRAVGRRRLVSDAAAGREA